MNDRIRLSFYNLIESMGQGDDCQWLLISQKETDVLGGSAHTCLLMASISSDKFL